MIQHQKRLHRYPKAYDKEKIVLELEGGEEMDIFKVDIALVTSGLILNIQGVMIKMNSELFEALKCLEKEKISARDTLLDAIKQSQA